MSLVLTSYVTAYRRQVATLVSERCTPPVYRYLPDDVAHLPCLVVGRPSIGETDTPAVMRMSLDVTLLGRRIGDDDSQAELDAYADELFGVLGATRNVRVGDGHLHCSLLLPATVIVAGLEMPAYVATVEMDTTSC